MGCPGQQQAPPRLRPWLGGTLPSKGWATSCLSLSSSAPSVTLKRVFPKPGGVNTGSHPALEAGAGKPKEEALVSRPSPQPPPLPSDQQQLPQHPPPSPSSPPQVHHLPNWSFLPISTNKLLLPCQSPGQGALSSRRLPKGPAECVPGTPLIALVGRPLETLTVSSGAGQCPFRGSQRGPTARRTWTSV